MTDFIPYRRLTVLPITDYFKKTRLPGEGAIALPKNFLMFIDDDQKRLCVKIAVGIFQIVGVVDCGACKVLVCIVW